ncbi:BppU family phage baseplate upper protein [Clostridium perfringens]|uniref:BppU family phage baseplate upper protein n=1 Tax=Clostridium perfringens TaxID=1502 RepID=UPI0024BC2859|nr:BppU family phage baseplate upper protein [Clostridium perfringens]
MSEIGLNINVDSYNNEVIKTIKGNNNAEIYKLYILKNKRRLSLVGKTVELGYVMVGTTNGDVINLNITNAEQGEITFPITNRISKKDGVYSCQLAILGEGDFLEHTATFTLTVENNIFSDITKAISDSKDFTYLERILEEASKLSEKLKENTSSATNANSNLESNITEANNINSKLLENTSTATSLNKNLESNINLAKEVKETIKDLDTKNIEATEKIETLTGLNSKATELSNNINQALPLNSELVKNTEEAKTANTNLAATNQEAVSKNTKLQASLEKTKEFINGLDGSQNIPQLRLDVTKLQNNMKTNQSFEYEGSSIRCENTLEGRTENMKIKGITLLNYARTNTPVIIPTGYRIPIDYLGLEKGETYSFYVTYLPNGATWSVNNPSIDTSFTEDNLKVRTLSKEFDNNFKSISIKCSNITLEEAKKTKLIVLKGDWSNKEIPEYFEAILNMGEQEKEQDKYKIIFSSSNSTGDIVDRKTILIDAPLMGLDNLQDTILEENGVVNLSKIIDNYSCTGNEEIADTTATDETSGTNKYKVFKLTPSKTINTIKVLNNLFPTVTFNTDFQSMDGEGLAVTGVGVYIKILKSKLSTQNVDGFKAWLKANTLTIYYALESPVITKIPKLIDIDLNTYNGATTFKIENAIKGTLDFKVPSNIASVVQNMAKEVNEIWDVINNLLVPGLMDTKKNIALKTIKNNLK